MRVVSRDNGYEKIEASGLSVGAAEVVARRVAATAFGADYESCRYRGRLAWGGFGFGVEVQDDLETGAVRLRERADELEAARAEARHAERVAARCPCGDHECWACGPLMRGER
jgi:hypothetical protein